MAFESSFGAPQYSSTRSTRDQPVYPGLDDSPTHGESQPGLYQDDGFFSNIMKMTRQPLTSTPAPPATPVPMQPANPLGGIMDFLTAFNSPSLVTMQNQQNRLMGLEAAHQANFGAQKGFLGQENNLSKQLLRLKEQGLLNQQGANQKEYGFLDQFRDLANRGFANQEGQIKEKGEQQHRATKNDFVGRGGGLAPEHSLQHTDIDQEMASAIEAARIGLDKELTGLDQQQARLDLASQNLGLDLQGIGINAQQLDLNLEMGLANLGLNQLISMNELWDKMENSQGQELDFWKSIFEQAFQWGQMGDQLLGLGF